MNTRPPFDCKAWITDHADSLDNSSKEADALLPVLGKGGLTGVGIPVSEGGNGGPASEAVRVVADLAACSLTAAFAYWAHRSFIECLIQTPNVRLRQRLLPPLLRGEWAGATALSNGMKFLAGFDLLQVNFHGNSGMYVLNGQAPWVTNLRGQGYVVALAAGSRETGAPAVFAVPGEASGIERSADFELIGLQASNTASLSMTDVRVGEEWLLHPDAKLFLPKLRPVFLGLQCGMAAGLARASLAAARQVQLPAGSILLDEQQSIKATLDDYWTRLLAGVDSGIFGRSPQDLFVIRIGLVELALRAVQHELQVYGGRAYTVQQQSGFFRRWREAAFLPIFTPTVVQLKTQLALLG